MDEFDLRIGLSGMAWTSSGALPNPTMHSAQSPPPATLLLLLLSSICAVLGHDHSRFHPSRSQPTNNHPVSSPADYACQPIGPCQPCPPDQLTNPICEIYHNRRLVDCIYLGSSSPGLIASVLRDPGTYASGLMIYRPSIDPSHIDASSSSDKNDNNQSTSNSKEVSDHQNQIGAGEGAAEFQTWEACERVVLKERQDFYEFILCNIVIAGISLLVYGFRTKQLVVKQYRNLAARIGILPT